MENAVEGEGKLIRELTYNTYRITLNILKQLVLYFKKLMKN